MMKAARVYLALYVWLPAGPSLSMCAAVGSTGARTAALIGSHLHGGGERITRLIYQSRISLTFLHLGCYFFLYFVCVARIYCCVSVDGQLLHSIAVEKLMLLLQCDEDATLYKNNFVVSQVQL